MKNKLFFVCSTLFAFSLSQHASANVNPYRDCGIGAAIFKNDTGATISNVLWDLGTTAITSATASPDTCEGSEVAAAEFIIETYANLVEETAKGSGDHLNALLQIAGVAQEKQALVTSALRDAIAEVVSQPSYVDSSAVDRASAYFESFRAIINA